MHSLKHIEIGFNATIVVSGLLREAIEFDHNELFALQRLIIELETLHIPEFLKVYALRFVTSGINNNYMDN